MAIQSVGEGHSPITGMAIRAAIIGPNATKIAAFDAPDADRTAVERQRDSRGQYALMEGLDNEIRHGRFK